MPNGEKYWIFEGWTKGFLFIHYGGEEPILEYPYEIYSVDEEIYMFLEINTKEESYSEVFQKYDDKKYKLDEIGRHDDIDMPYVYDDIVVGKWKTVGFVSRIEEFNTNDKNYELYLERVQFNEDGSAEQKYFDDEVWNDRWTKGYLLNLHRKTASKYKIKKIDNDEYLFIEWKMGNYIYGEQEPSYYVLERE